MAALYLDTDLDVTLALSTKPVFDSNVSVVLTVRAAHPSAKVAIIGLIENQLLPQVACLNVSVQGEPVHLFHLLFSPLNGIQKNATTVDTQGFQLHARVSES